MNRLCDEKIEPRDQTYRFIRDDTRGAEMKSFVERLWSFYAPYADRSFKADIAISFPEKFSEMYLAFGLDKQEAKLQLISSGRQGRGSRKGPDLLLSGLTHDVWIEATVPSDGMAADRVPEERLGTDQDIPSDSLILRYRTGIYDKFKKLRGYLKAGIVKDSDPYIIAINSRSLSFSLYEPDLPRIFQALFPLGNLVATLHRTTKGWSASIDYSYRDKITKKSGCPVSTNVFLDPRYERISAVIYCPSDVWHPPPNDAEVGLDFMLIHNPMAKKKNALPHGWLKCGRECWVENDQLVMKNWCKEHPSYTKESEPKMTMEDMIQKNNAQRRVG